MDEMDRDRVAAIVGAIIKFTAATYFWFEFEQMSDHPSLNPLRVVRNHFMRLHPLVADWAWVGMLISGIGIEGAQEYLLGLMFLCAAAASLALVSIRIT